MYNFILHIFLFLSMSVVPVRAQNPGEILSIASAELAPTQNEIGQASIESMMLNWVKKGGGTAEGLKQTILQVVKKPFPAVIGPNALGDQTTYILDGHHRAVCIHQILYGDYDRLPLKIRELVTREELLMWRSSPQFRINVKVEQVHSTHSDLLRAMIKSGVGQFSEEIRNAPEFQRVVSAIKTGHEQADDLQYISDIYGQLPQNFDQLEDSPLRSAIGEVFFSLEMHASSTFENYIEFKLADLLGPKLAARGIIVSNHNALDPVMKEYLIRMILEDQEILDFLYLSARDGKYQVATERILQQLEAHKLRIESNPALSLVERRSIASRCDILRGIYLQR